MCLCWTNVKQVFSRKNKKKETEKTEKTEKSAKKEEKEEKKTEESHDSAGTPAETNKNKSAVEETDSKNDSCMKSIEKYQFTKVLLGQPNYSGIKHPKDYLRKTLESERPDLVPVGSALDDREIRLLDGHLTLKGEMRGGITLKEGYKSSVFSSTEVGVGNNMDVAMLYAKGRFGAVYVIRANECMRALKIPLRMYASRRMEQEIAMLRYLFKLFTDEIDKDRLREERKNTSMSLLGQAGKPESEVKEVKKKEEKTEKSEEDKKENEREEGGTDNETDKEKKRKKDKKKERAKEEQEAIQRATKFINEDKGLSHLVGIADHGMNGGTPYLIMPLYDASLGKIRQELEAPIRPFEAFHLCREALVGIKQCYAKGISHRDLKPTNLLLGSDSNTIWMLCDFGEACLLGEAKTVSYPDNVTLPYMSRMAHEAIVKPAPATVWWDLESWLYLLLEFFVPLPWMGKEVDEAYKMKQDFWRDLDGFLAKHAATIPPEFVPIAKFIEARKPDREPHAKLTELLRAGYVKHAPKNFNSQQFVWVEKRKGRKKGLIAGKGGVSTVGAPKSKKGSQKSQKSKNEKSKSQKSKMTKSKSQKSKNSKIQKSKSQKSQKSRKSQKSKIEKSKSQKTKKSQKSQKSKIQKSTNSQVQKSKSQKSQKSKSQKTKSQMSKIAK